MPAMAGRILTEIKRPLGAFDCEVASGRLLFIADSGSPTVCNKKQNIRPQVPYQRLAFYPRVGGESLVRSINEGEIKIK